MTILCTIDLETREVSIPSGQCIAAYDHNVDVIRFQAETIPGFSLDTSTIRIAAQGPNKARHDYAVDPSTVQIEEETGYITFDWPIPAGVTEMPIGTFKYGDKGNLIFAVCAEIIDGSTVSKAWHSDDGIITVVAHLEPESGGGEDPEEEATNAQKIAQLQTDVAVINTQVGALANGSPAPVETVAEMTDESAVYLYTGSETGYTAGNWYYYDGSDWTSGGTYGGAVTSTTFTEHGVPADDFAVGQALALKANDTDVTALDTRVTAVEGDVDSITEHGTTTTTYTNGSEIFTTQQGYIYSDGSVKSASSENHGIWYFQANADMEVYITDLLSDTAKYRMAVYEGTPLTTTGLVAFYSTSTGSPLPLSADSAITVESGQYVALTIYNQTDASKKGFSLVCITEGGEITLASDLGLTDTMTEEVEALIGTSAETAAQETVEDALSNLYANDGWYNLPASDFALNAWSSYSTTDNRTFRVRCTKDLIFDRDVFIRAKAGFAVSGFYSDGTGISATEILKLPANTAVHLYVRRHTEDTSETADISEFADAMLISTPFADMERLLPTFTDISMFERVGIGGDSYAGGGGIISGIRSLTWGKNLERQAGITVDIYAKSGQDVMGWVSDSTNGLPALLAGAECGLYWLAHGINGTSTAELLGTSADMSASPRPATFYGQYAEAIEQIKTAFPNAKIVIQTIIGSNYGLYQYHYNLVNQAIRDIAEYCQIPVIDVADDEFYLSPYYSDNIRSNHPTAMVAAGMAMANRRLLSKCILENPAYFIDYGSN